MVTERNVRLASYVPSMEITGMIIAALAALAAIASAIIARQQKVAADAAAQTAKDEATDARAAATRAATAAEASAESHAKLAAIAETEAAAPPWDITQVGEHQYAARNGGPTPVYNVTAQVTGFASDRKAATDQLDPGAKLLFFAAATMQEPEVAVTITWSDTPDGPTQQWTDQVT